MIRSIICLCLSLTLTLLFAGPTDAANKPKNRKPGRGQANKNQSAQKARANLNAAQRDVSAAANQIGAAKEQLDHARDKAIDTRHNVTEQLDQLPALEAARKRWDSARAELAKLSEPVLDKLELDPAYQAAVADRDRLRAESLQAPPNSSEQSRLQREWAEANAKTRQMEQAALRADDRTRVALENVAAEEADLKKQVNRKESELKNDSQLNAATSDIQRAKSALANAQAHYAAELRQLAQAQRNAIAKTVQAKNKRARRR